MSTQRAEDGVDPPKSEAVLADAPSYETSDRLAALQYILSKTHPAHIQAVVSACRGMMQYSDSNASPNLLENAMEQYNESVCTSFVMLNCPQPVICCRPAKLVHKDCYYDPTSDRPFRVNHLAREATQISESDVQNDLLIAAHKRGRDSKYRLAVQSAVDEYMCVHFPSTAGAGATDNRAAAVENRVATTVFCTVEDSHHIISIVIRSPLINVVTACAGLWLSNWSVEFTPSNGKSSCLNGAVRVNLIYKEDGDLSVTQSKDFTLPLDADLFALEPSAFANTIVSIIRKNECKLQRDLLQLMGTIDSHLIQSLRRLRPIVKRSTGSLSESPIDKLRTELIARTASTNWKTQ